jgi:hypothetical protein
MVVDNSVDNRCKFSIVTILYRLSQGLGISENKTFSVQTSQNCDEIEVIKGIRKSMTPFIRPYLFQAVINRKVTE